ncbi:MAG: hypothetical protein IT225_08440 [Flavobacteriales bacterium]|jgi:antitoxin component YwqK of YwqJK toxin-antitoxin module|nr:hypothetical protein [Flavobacteriales bacterium]
MKTTAIILLLLASYAGHAQQMDTTEVKNGRYWVLERGKDGRAAGVGMAYDSTGRLVGHGTYRRGLAHGQWVWYDDRGRRTWATPYVKGFLHGTAIQYDSLERKTWSIMYRKGQRHGLEEYFHPDGGIMVSQHHRNGLVHGRSITYHRNGRVEWTKAYREGKLHGERVLRDSTGALVDGEYVSSYPLDRGHLTTTCINGRPQGKWVATRKDGQVTITGNYTDGYPDGEVVFFAPDGSIWRKEYYEMGRFVRSTQRGNNGDHTPDQYPLPHTPER